jgi:hypothetical protein
MKEDNDNLVEEAYEVHNSKKPASREEADSHVEDCQWCQAYMAQVARRRRFFKNTSSAPVRLGF